MPWLLASRDYWLAMFGHTHPSGFRGVAVITSV